MLCQGFLSKVRLSKGRAWSGALGFCVYIDSGVLGLWRCVIVEKASLEDFCVGVLGSSHNKQHIRVRIQLLQSSRDKLERRPCEIAYVQAHPNIYAHVCRDCDVHDVHHETTDFPSLYC